MNMTLKSFSNLMNISVLELIKKFAGIGIIKKESDSISLNEKKLLLHYLSSKNELSLNDEKKNNIININKSKSIHSTNYKINNKYINIKNKNITNIENKNKNHVHTISKGQYNKINDVRKKNILNIVEVKKKHDIYLKKPDKLNKKKDFQVKNSIYYKKTNTHVSKKIKEVSSNKAMINHLSYDYNLKRFSSLNKIQDKNNIISYDNHSSSKRKKFKNKNKKPVNYDVISNQDFNQLIVQSPVKNIKNIKKYLLKQNLKKFKNNFVKHVIIGNTITISNLSNKLAIKSVQLINMFFGMGIRAHHTHILDQKLAKIIVEEIGYDVILRHDNELEKLMLENCYSINKKYDKKIRPPIVTIVGHVDHGKTSLLDYIRSTKVVSGEFGGITQHIGAYHIEVEKKIITFLDTPGHSAFVQMRARGIQLTDIVVLVIAGDDGIKPQTIESIKHIQHYNVPLIVAINKIDKPTYFPDKIKQELMKYSILSEELGGETIFVGVSAITGEGINNLLNSILLQSEIMELYTISEGIASGIVVEASLSKNYGPIATVIVKEGILNKGDYILCGLSYGKVRSITNCFGDHLIHVGPSIPVEIFGLSSVPNSGDSFNVVKNERQAREIIESKKNIQENQIVFPTKETDVNHVFEKFVQDKRIILNFVVKCDVQGSLEAILEYMSNLSNKYVMIKIVHASVGNITETDVSLSVSSRSQLIGFNVKANVLANCLIKKNNININYYSVIYNLIDDIQSIINTYSIPKKESLFFGSAEVRNIFKLTKHTFIAGCMVMNGVIKKKYSVRILRNNKIIYIGELESLRRFKEDINEVGTGKECGIVVKNYNEICVGDMIESYQMLS
ncbi:Translation initiation factor IF-2 [isoform alpha] [Buchnera aphidicola (Pterocallis alni)]|uniref:translation initiation factor IF-2 n=1 Tax=Buchnera aphidicola TaxID=9 RepID=UPI00346495BF